MDMFKPTQYERDWLARRIPSIFVSNPVDKWYDKQRYGLVVGEIFTFSSACNPPKGEGMVHIKKYAESAGEWCRRVQQDINKSREARGKPLIIF